MPVFPGVLCNECLPMISLYNFTFDYSTNFSLRTFNEMTPRSIKCKRNNCDIRGYPLAWCVRKEDTTCLIGVIESDVVQLQVWGHKDWQLKHTLLVDVECNGLLEQETELPIACPTVKLCLLGCSHSLQYTKCPLKRRNQFVTWCTYLCETLLFYSSYKSSK